MMNNKTLGPGWRWVKFGDVVRLSKARSQDPLADDIERYVSLEHLKPCELRIGRIRISVQSSQLPLHRRLAAFSELLPDIATNLTQYP